MTLRSPEARGFTLLEVLLAIFVLATLMGALVTSVAQSLHAMSRAQRSAEVMRLAETRVREIMETSQMGELPELGTSRGRFEPPSDDHLWELTVEPYAIPLPEASEETRSASSLFAAPSTGPTAPQPSVRRIVLRVFHEDADPERADPFVVFAVEPPSPEEIPVELAEGEELIQ